MSIYRRKTTRVLMVVVLALLSLQLVAGRLRINTGSGGGGGGGGGTTVGGGGGTTMVPAIPEPASFAVFALGIGLVGLAVRRKQAV